MKYIHSLVGSLAGKAEAARTILYACAARQRRSMSPAACFRLRR